jgi:hypothetical protein
MPLRAPEVLRYFLKHRRAADSLEGVVRFRLAHEMVHRSVTEVAEALHWLVERDLLVERSARGTPPIFSLNNHRLGEIRSLLAKASGDAR